MNNDESVPVDSPEAWKAHVVDPARKGFEAVGIDVSGLSDDQVMSASEQIVSLYGGETPDLKQIQGVVDAIREAGRLVESVRPRAEGTGGDEPVGPDGNSALSSSPPFTASRCDSRLLPRSLLPDSSESEDPPRRNKQGRSQEHPSLARGPRRRDTTHGTPVDPRHARVHQVRVDHHQQLVLLRLFGAARNDPQGRSLMTSPGAVARPASPAGATVVGGVGASVVEGGRPSPSGRACSEEAS